jgi:outer membrane immunogenic protein
MRSKIIVTTFVAAALISGSIAARAADMPAFSKAPIAEPGWSWSGVYIGLQGGAGWGTVEDMAKTTQSCPAGGPCGLVTAFPAPDSQRSNNALSGFHGGGTAGYNFQYGQVVFGLEGDFSGANIEGRGDCSNSLGFVNAFGEAAGCHAKMTWFGTGTARLGLTVDRALIFIKGGGAWAHFDESATANNPVGLGGPFALGAPNSLTSSHSTTRGGFTVGTGIEYALGSNLSAKVEYDYMDFGSNNVSTVKNPQVIDLESGNVALM